MKRILLALLVNLLAVTGAYAQTAPQRAHDLTAITAQKSIIVVDDLGKKTQGKLLRFTPDKLLMLVEGSEIAIDRRNVAKVFTRGDSVVNGMLLGVLGGTALGVVGVVTSENPGGLEGAAAVAFTVIGLGVGTAVDALITGQKLVYERAAGHPIAISIAPSVSRGGLGMSTSVSW